MQHRFSTRLGKNLYLRGIFIALSLLALAPFTPARAVDDFDHAGQARDAQPPICCHCFRGTTPYCMRFTGISACGDFRNANTFSAVQHDTPDVVENLRCDNGVIPEERCVPGTGIVGDRCPTSPPPTDLEHLASQVIRIRDAAGPAINNTLPTHGETELARQQAAINIPRNFPNPLPGLTLQNAIGGIIRIIIGLVGILFLLVFIYGSVLYMTAAGDSKQVETAKTAIRNATIGLIIVMVSYTVISLLIGIASSMMGANTAPRISQRNSSQTIANTAAANRAAANSANATNATANSASNAPAQAPVSGSAAAGCRSFYGVDPSPTNCPLSQCPAGARTIDDLFQIRRASMPGDGGTAVQAACGSCIAQEITRLSAANPGLDTTCVPALMASWDGICASACNRAPETTSGGDPSLCSTGAYIMNTGCTACLTYGRTVANATAESVAKQNILRASCADTDGRVLVWCAAGHAGWAHSGDTCSPR